MEVSIRNTLSIYQMAIKEMMKEILKATT